MGPEPMPYWDVADDLGRMNDLEFTALCNDLLHAERLVAREPVDAVDTTTNVDAPDGGVDARTQFSVGTDYVPVGETVWQYKATSPGPADLADEITERGDESFLLSRLRAGAKYVVLATADWTSEQMDLREEKVRKALAERGLDRTEVLVRNASHVAEWVSGQPAVAATHANRIPPGFEPLSMRMAQPRYSQDFHPDLAREGLINDVATALGSPGGARHIRIEGPAGIGKTRAAIEALRPFTVIALYCANPPRDPVVGRELVRSGKTAILILDECSRNTAEEWSQALAEAEGRLRLITIDTSIAQQPQGDDVIRLSGLDRAQVIAVARDAAPELAGRDADLEWVADMCEGFVKLAGPLAEALASTPGAQANRLTESRQVRDVLDLLIKDPAERRAITGLSLFQHVGFAGDVQSESLAVAKYLQVPWRDFRDAVQRLIDRGLLAQRGRYLYVTPALLALWLVAEELRAEGNRIWEVLEEEGAPPIDRLAARIAQLEGNRHARTLAGEVLRADGPFGSMQVLDSEGAAFLFRALSKVAPTESASLLRHLVEETPVGGLRTMTRGRRNLVWALEDLAVTADTFAPAAASLLRLAAAENEDYANNATRTFCDLFQLVLGRTRLPAQKRLEVLAELIRDASDEEAQVAIAALASSLRTEEVGRPIGGDRGAAPSESWHPTSFAEADAARRQALKMLRQQMESEVEDRRQAAIGVFRRQLNSVIALGLGEEARTTLVEMSLEDASGPDERELLGAIGSVLEYELESLRPDEQAAWKELAERVLYGSFHRSMLSRVRAWDSRSSYPFDQESLQEEISSLALQAAQYPELLDRELEWLCAHEPVPNIHIFGQSLGRQDGQGVFTDRLMSAAATTGDTRLLASYIGGRSLGDDELVTLLNRLEQHPRTREVLPRLIVQIPGSSRFWEQFRRCIGEKPSSSEVLDDIAVAWLAEGLSDTDAVDLVGLLVERATPASLQIALEILDRFVARSGTDEAIIELAWQVLEQPGGISTSNLWSYRWSRVARHIMGYDRSRMVASLLRQAKEEPVRFTHSALADVLHEALSGADLSTWERFIERLDESPEIELPLQWWSQEKAALEQVPLATLEAWTRGDLDRLERLAGFARAGETLTPLVIWIVEQAGARSRAARRLRSQMGTGVFWGSLAGRDQGFRDFLAEWARDSSSEAIRLWAQDGIRAIEERLPAIQEWEDETELLTG